MTVWRMRLACWITKATNTHSEYVLLIAFPLQQRLHESSLMLRYTYNAFVVPINVSVFVLHILHLISRRLYLFFISY